MTPLRLEVLGRGYVVARFPPDRTLAAAEGPFASITRTPDELSVVVQDGALPPGAANVERGFALLRVRGPLPFEQTGVMAALAGTLSAAGISILPIATFDTDYLLVKESALARAVDALRAAGHAVASAG